MMMDNTVPSAGAADSTTEPSFRSTQAPGPGGTAPPSGRREAFRDIRRQLSEDDLASPGVQRLVLDELESAEAECEQLRAYVERYHDADKRAAVLEERLRPSRAIDVFFGIGVGVGSAIVGLAPFFWSTQPQGQICLVIGAALIIGATIGKFTKG